MNIQSNLEINFHQQDEASVFLENTTSGEEEKFGEILLFCCVALRTIVNFGNHQAAELIAMTLSQVGGNLKELAGHDSPDAAKLIDYPGSAGRKRFLVTLGFSSDNFNFQYKPKGFGLLGIGTGYYAPNAVMLLLRYLTKKRLDDEEFIERLENAVEQCGAIYYRGGFLAEIKVKLLLRLLVQVMDLTRN